MDIPGCGVEDGFSEDAEAGLVGAAVADGAPPSGAEDDQLAADEIVVGKFRVVTGVVGGRAGGAGVGVATGAEGGADGSTVGRGGLLSAAGVDECEDVDVLVLEPPEDLREFRRCEAVDVEGRDGEAGRGGCRHALEGEKVSAD